MRTKNDWSRDWHWESWTGQKDRLSIWWYRFCDIDFKEVVIWSLIVRSDSCDWRCGSISRWTGFREKRRWSDEHLYPSTVIGDYGWSRDVFMLKISPLGGNLWTSGSRRRRRHLRKTADQRNRSHLREMNIASYSIQASPACCMAWA